MKTQADENWLDENVTTYEPGSIPVDLSPAQAKREFPGGHGWGAFTDEHGVKTTYLHAGSVGTHRRRAGVV